MPLSLSFLSTTASESPQDGYAGNQYDGTCDDENERGGLDPNRAFNTVLTDAVTAVQIKQLTGTTLFLVQHADGTVLTGPMLITGTLAAIGSLSMDTLGGTVTQTGVVVHAPTG